MATSGDTSWNVNRDQVIRGALRKVGASAPGLPLTTDDYTDCGEALNNLVMSLQVEGMPLWAMKEYTFNLTQGVNSYNIGLGQTLNTPAPLKIVQAYTRDLNSLTDIPMNIYTHYDFNLLANKTPQTPQGYPIHLWYEPNNQNQMGTMHIWPSPDAYSQTSRTITIVYQAPFEVFDASTDTPDFPQYWIQALIWLLAAQVAPEYGVPISDRSQLVQMAMIEKERALSFGTEEGSLFLQPDWITYYNDRR